MQIHNVIQKSEEWFELRRKHPLTASNAQAIATGGKGLETLVWETLAEKYSFADKDRVSNKDMERGVELEDQARDIYQLETGLEVYEIGFITNEVISPVGGVSPDGAIKNKKGGIEIKCFDDTKHFKYSIEGLTPESQYEWQMQMQMLFAEWDFVDFCAYNPNYKKSLLIKRIPADKERQQKIIDGLKIGEELIKKIEAQYKK
jgi:putative phage-type endonuclease